MERIPRSVAHHTFYDLVIEISQQLDLRFTFNEKRQSRNLLALSRNCRRTFHNSHVVGSRRSMKVWLPLSAHYQSPATEAANKMAGIRRGCAAFFPGTLLPGSKCDAAITAGTYARVSAGINRFLLKSTKSLLPDLKTAFCITISPTLYAARASDQSPNCACRARR